MGLSRVWIEIAPYRLESAHSKLFSNEALEFLSNLVSEFDKDVDKLHQNRQIRALGIKNDKWRPKFKNYSENLDWQINSLPDRLKNRKLDLGDVSPANTVNFIDSLFTEVQGIQVDFDDGFCPTWRNTIQGIYNVTQAVHSELHGGPVDMTKAPILMMRPRAFNMIEHHCMINGKQVAGPLFDFGLLMFHNAQKMTNLGIGPYFYLSKIEDPSETQLWNKIFTWTEHKLGIPNGTIKACVLIENILAAFHMEDILYSIKEHAIGLNCGIWDYSASIIAKFGDDPNFLIPDRNKYVNMDQGFLKNYMNLLIYICHRRGALATGGMNAKLLLAGKEKDTNESILKGVKMAKTVEIEAGVDGFMVYDIRLVEPMNELWEKKCKGDNQINVIPNIENVTAECLLDIPRGGVTMAGLKHNISVALLFIYHWLSGSGVFFFNGGVEDSATAEISRSQIWQWIRHNAPFEDMSEEFVTRNRVYQIIDTIINECTKTWCKSSQDKKKLLASKYMLLDIISSRNYIDFVTTYLNDSHKFRTIHNKNDGLLSKL